MTAHNSADGDSISNNVSRAADGGKKSTRIRFSESLRSFLSRFSLSSNSSRANPGTLNSLSQSSASSEPADTESNSNVQRQRGLSLSTTQDALRHVSTVAAAVGSPIQPISPTPGFRTDTIVIKAEPDGVTRATIHFADFKERFEGLENRDPGDDGKLRISRAEESKIVAETQDEVIKLDYRTRDTRVQLCKLLYHDDKPLVVRKSVLNELSEYQQRIINETRVIAQFKHRKGPKGRHPHIIVHVGDYALNLGDEQKMQEGKGKEREAANAQNEEENKEDMRILNLVLYPAGICDMRYFLDRIDELNVCLNAGIEPEKREKYLEERALLLKNLIPAIRCLAEALAFLHARGIFHRDIKPENVIFDTAGLIVLIDFGCSILSGDEKKDSDPMPGTARYRAPEYVSRRVKDISDKEADMFSLGCIYLEVATVILEQPLKNFTEARKNNGKTKNEDFGRNIEALEKWIKELEQICTKGLQSNSIDPDCQDIYRLVRDELLVHTKLLLNNYPNARPSARDLANIWHRLHKEPCTLCVSQAGVRRKHELKRNFDEAMKENMWKRWLYKHFGMTEPEVIFLDENGQFQLVPLSQANVNSRRPIPISHKGSFPLPFILNFGGPSESHVLPLQDGTEPGYIRTNIHALLRLPQMQGQKLKRKHFFRLVDTIFLPTQC